MVPKPQWAFNINRDYYNNLIYQNQIICIFVHKYFEVWFEIASALGTLHLRILVQVQKKREARKKKCGHWSQQS